MDAVKTLELLISLTTAAINFSEQAQKISMMLKKAQMENRPISDAEWAEAFSTDDLARLRLVAQLAKM
jgi:hypothetical protein